MSGEGAKIASNIKRVWWSLAQSAYYRGGVEPKAVMLSPAAAEKLGDEWIPGTREIIDTWAWGWMIRMADGTYRP